MHRVTFTAWREGTAPAAVFRRRRLTYGSVWVEATYRRCFTVYWNHVLLTWTEHFKWTGTCRLHSSWTCLYRRCSPWEHLREGFVVKFLHVFFLLNWGGEVNHLLLSWVHPWFPSKSKSKSMMGGFGWEIDPWTPLKICKITHEKSWNLSDAIIFLMKFSKFRRW